MNVSSLSSCQPQRSPKSTPKSAVHHHVSLKCHQNLHHSQQSIIMSASNVTKIYTIVSSPSSCQPQMSPKPTPSQQSIIMSASNVTKTYTKVSSPSSCQPQRSPKPTPKSAVHHHVSLKCHKNLLQSQQSIIMSASKVTKTYTKVSSPSSCQPQRSPKTYTNVNIPSSCQPQRSPEPTSK